MSAGIDVDVVAVRGSSHGDGGVVFGTELLRFTEAVLARDGDPAGTRRVVVDTLGHDAMVDAAAIIATFEMMNRIANATGTPLDPQLVEPTADLAARVGATSFPSAEV